MCSSKKWVGGLAALALLIVSGFVVMQTPVGTWVEVQWDKVGNWFNKQVTPEDQLAGLAKEVTKLDSAIDEQYDKIVTQKRVVEKAAKVIADAENEKNPNSLATRWEIIHQLDVAIKAAEKDDKTTVSFESKSTALSDARKERTRRWEAFKKDKAALDAQKKLLDEQRATLAVMVQTYEDMKTAKADLERKHQELTAKLESIRAAQVRDAAGKANDGWKTQFTKANELANQLEDQFEVMNHKVQDQAKAIESAKDTGAAQKVLNDKAADEIEKFAAEQDNSARK